MSSPDLKVISKLHIYDVGEVIVDVYDLKKKGRYYRMGKSKERGEFLICTLFIMRYEDY